MEGFCFNHSQKLTFVVLPLYFTKTSITIPGIVYVIDCGFVKQKMYDPVTQMDALLVMPISQAAATQRAGRAGRTKTGKAYRLYSKETHDENFPDETTPEIQRTSLLETVLCLKQMNIIDVLGFDFLDRPDPLLVLSALRQLYYIGALGSNGQITPLGKWIANLPVSPFLGRALYAAGKEMNCLKEMIIISSMLSVEHVWVEIRGRGPRADEEYENLLQRRKDLYHITGDHLTLLNVCDPGSILFEIYQS
jgi:HrpA-like RNA helicase